MGHFKRFARPNIFSEKYIKVTKKIKPFPGVLLSVYNLSQDCIQAERVSSSPEFDGKIKPQNLPNYANYACLVIGIILSFFNRWHYVQTIEDREGEGRLVNDGARSLKLLR